MGAQYRLVDHTSGAHVFLVLTATQHFQCCYAGSETSCRVLWTGSNHDIQASTRHEYYRDYLLT